MVAPQSVQGGTLKKPIREHPCRLCYPVGFHGRGVLGLFNYLK
jgi:hypothetical protein